MHTRSAPPVNARGNHTDSLAERLVPCDPLDLIRAWDKWRFYAPVLNALHRLPDPTSGSNSNLLQVGGEAVEFQAFLETSRQGRRDNSSQPEYEIHYISESDFGTSSFPDNHFDCAVVLDWLPQISQGRRRQAVAELCRITKSGVCILCPFDTEGVREAETQVNEIYRALHGSDAPHLVKHREYDLPELEPLKVWLSEQFEYTVSLGIEHLDTWKLLETLRSISDAWDDAAHRSSKESIAISLALLQWLPNDNRAPCYRHIVIAASGVLEGNAELESRPASTTPINPLLLYTNLQAIAQRRAYEELVNHLVEERARDSQAFEDSLRQLANEILTKNTDGEQALAERDTTIKDQETELRKLRQQFNAIVRSRGWRLLSAYYRLRTLILRR